MPEANETVTVTVTVPGLLARFTDDRRTIPIRAASLEECIERLLEAYPAIEPHLLDRTGRLRSHLKLFHDGTGVAWSESAAVELADGDEVIVLQAVSGG